MNSIQHRDAKRQSRLADGATSRRPSPDDALPGAQHVVRVDAPGGGRRTAWRKERLNFGFLCLRVLTAFPLTFAGLYVRSFKSRCKDRVQLIGAIMMVLVATAACGGASTDTPAPATPTTAQQALAPTETPAPEATPTATSVPATETLAPSATPQPSATQTATNTATPTPGPATYRLRPGDTLGAVAANAGVSLDALLSLNGLSADDIVKKGLVLQLPAGSTPPELWPAPTPEPLATFVTDVPPEEAPTIYLGSDEQKRVALTFDTGYDPEINAEIAALLAERDVRATFFVVGRGVEQYPEVVEDIVRYNHELANHSWSHQDLTEMTPAQVRAELLDTEEIVQELAPGATTKPFFRAPFGYVDETVDRIAKEEGFYVVDWTFDSLDWVEGITPVEVRWTVERKLRPGAIVVMHGSSEATLEALPVVLDMLEGSGYEAVTLSELLAPANE